MFSQTIRFNESQTPNFNIIDNIKGFFHQSSQFYNSNVTLFYQELKSLMRKLGINGNITIKNNYEGDILEKEFIIRSDEKIGIEDKIQYMDIIVEYMAEYCKENNMFDFYKDTYILIK